LLLVLLKLAFETADFSVVLHEPVLILVFPVCEAIETHLVRFVKIVVKDDDGLVLANGIAHVADSVLFGVRTRELFFVLTALFANAGTAPEAVPLLRFEGA
jgi:hypothetical protein